MSATEKADVIVVGGGPGGSTVATLLAKAGHRVVLLEKEQFPRYQIGESLLPSTIHGVCRLLGVDEKITAAGFMHKRGGSFRWGTNPVPWNFLFAISPEFAGDSSYAYQVDRMTFDNILLEHSAASGVDVRQRSRVTGVIRGAERVTGVRYVGEDRTEREVHAQFVVDASGNTTRLSKQAGGERVYSEHFQNVALFGYFEGGKRFPAPDTGNILCAAFDEGWIWYIPLSDTLTSVGVVLAKDKLTEGAVRADEEVLRSYIDRCAIVKDMLLQANRVTEGIYGEIRIRKDYSYANTRFWGEGMVLVGDAACFIDPVFSTGVHLATYSAVLAARSINSVLAGTVTEDRAFDEFEGRYRREYAVFYEFLSAFYDMEQSEESYFWTARKVTNFDRTDMASFVSLVAGGYSGEDVLTDPDAVIAKFAASTEALTTAAARTGGMDTDSGQRMGHLFSAPVVRDVMEEMNALQARGATAESTVEAPLLPGGLVPSNDGLSWAEPAPATV